MNIRNQRNQAILFSLISSAVAMAVAACGKAPASGTPGGVTLQAAPLAGPNAASLWKPGFNLASLESLSGGLMSAMLGIQNAYAAIPSFSSFTACNDTLILLDGNGNPVNINGSTNLSVGQGLLTFSPTSTTPMSIGSLNIPAGTVLSEIDITFATVPSLCQGANYAVRFADGIHGVIDVTQNTAFKFKFPAGGTQVTGNAQTVNLMFGQIVTGMVNLGASLNNSTIQTVNVGQAQ